MFMKIFIYEFNKRIDDIKYHRRNKSFFACYEKENNQFLDVMISIFEIYFNFYQLINFLDNQWSVKQGTLREAWTHDQNCNKQECRINYIIILLKKITKGLKDKILK